MIVDTHPVICLYSLVRRRLAHRGGRDAHAGVVDRLNCGFVRYVLTYRSHMLPRVLHTIRSRAQPTPTVRVAGRRGARRLMAEISGA